MAFLDSARGPPRPSWGLVADFPTSDITERSLAAAACDLEAMQLDEGFVAAFDLKAPPMGGKGLGIDRLLMLYSGAGIQETVIFPLFRPHE